MAVVLSPTALEADFSRDHTRRQPCRKGEDPRSLVAKPSTFASGRAQKEKAPPPPPPSSSSTHQKPSAGARSQERKTPVDVEHSKDKVAMGLWTRGIAALEAGQAVRALRIFDECIAKDPNAAAFVRSRGDAHAMQKQYALALPDYQHAYTLLKTALPAAAASVLLKVARCHLRTGSYTPAIDAVRGVLAVTPGDLEALRLKKHLVAIEDAVEAYRNASARRQWKAARTAFRACRNAHEEESSAVPVGVRCWEVEVAVAEGRWTEALGISATVLADHPKSSEALLKRVLVLFLTTDLSGAVIQVQEVLKLDPDNTEAKAARSRFKSVLDLKQEGNTRFQNDNLIGAIEKWTNALELVAEKEEEGCGGRIRAILLLNRSRAKLKLGQHPDALKDVNAAGRLDPDNVKICITRARIYVGLELFDSAIQEFKAALEADTSKLAAGDRRIVQGELEEIEQRSAKERLKVKDYYEILEIDRNSTTAQIRKAFRTQSLKHHPDKGGIAEKFRLVTEAYTTLSDTVARARYDTRLPPKYAGPAQSGGPQGTKPQSSSRNTGPSATSSGSSSKPRETGGTDSTGRGTGTNTAGDRASRGFEESAGRPGAHQSGSSSYKHGSTGFGSSNGSKQHSESGQDSEEKRNASGNSERASPGHSTNQSGYKRGGAEPAPDSNGRSTGGGTSTSAGAQNRPAGGGDSDSKEKEQESTKSSWWWPFG
ncbi:hypothetical protein C8Q72DRAFT_921987 [Fomitopsis betulina]|nr:hypothetical protein C8Q72DRAFT_921987 [Fomitopsis betulina]